MMLDEILLLVVLVEKPSPECDKLRELVDTKRSNDRIELGTREACMFAGRQHRGREFNAGAIAWP
jgi:hypothetical protein